MKKRLVREVLSFTLFLGMVLSCNSYAGATDNRAAIAKATNVLLQSGWTQDEIDDHDVYYIYKADYKKGYESQTPTGTYKRNLAQVDVKYDSGGVIISQDLATGAWGAPGSGISYSNHRGFLQYRGKVNNAAATMAPIHVFYYHQQHILSVSPSVSWPRSASLSVSPASKFKEMTPNPYVSFEV